MTKHRLPSTLPTVLSCATAAIGLVACGGGDDPPAGGGGGGGAGAVGGTLTLSATTPAANNTTLNLGTAAGRGNNTRAADTFSAVPYCEVYFEGVPGANGVVYGVQVYFRQSDKAPLNASIVGGAPATFVIFNNNAGNPIGGLAVDTAARTIIFTNKTMSGSSGEVGTVNGTLTFPANATTPACGA